MKIRKVISLWSKQIKRDAVMLWFARKHPDTPLVAKVVCLVAVLYALSPIDLVPDFIPVLGYIDDALLLPAMIWLAVRLLPSQVLALCREQADDWIKARGLKPKSYIGAVVIVAIWGLLAYLCWRWISAAWGRFWVDVAMLSGANATPDFCPEKGGVSICALELVVDFPYVSFAVL